MKTFHIKIWFNENGKEQLMVEHSGLNFEEICRIENFINDIAHGK